MHWKREEKAFRLHSEAIEREGAKVFNLGWGTNVEGNSISICSKTDKGKFQSNIDFDSGEEEHGFL